EWALLAGEQMADRFFGLLWNLSSYAPLIAPEHQALRQAVTQRVWQVIEGANHNGRLKQILFEEPLRFMYGGIDGWLLCLNDIELAMLPVQMLAANVDAAGADFVNYFRAKRRLDSIGHHL
ncbi:NEL-type E3 ubiquitin ligase domain-containing protein, partial [Klebsiella pneumoniae]|uniref:NEL-type E3 ubiquitin ligase domain-containing protein n=2 Tax=Gammaproteobacteria TaxID=1236 RepID=UPI002AE0334E